MRRLLRSALCLACAVALPGALVPGTALATRPRVAALVEVSAQPIGPAEPTERRTHCATPARSTTDPATLPAGHRALNVPQAWRFSRGAGVRVAVIDTGITPHARLPRVDDGGDYVGAGDGLSDCDLHGTLVAGIIAGRPSPDDWFAGVAPEAELISVRQSSGAYASTVPETPVSGRTVPKPTVGAGYGPLSTLSRAIVRAVDLGAHVVTVSEAACVPGDSALNDDAVASALEFARRRDAVVVVAAGNLSRSGGCRDQNPVAAASPAAAWALPKTLATPARFGREILTVGAVDTRTGAPAEFSLRGPWVTVAAPGTATVSLAGTGSGTRLVDALDGDDGPRPLTGTGYAAAYVAGVVALVRARHPRLTAQQVRDRIVRTAQGGAAFDSDDPDSAVGFGVVDPVAALTAQLPEVDDLPDPRAGVVLAAPVPEEPDHRGVVAVAAALALGAAVVAAVFALTRSRATPPIPSDTWLHSVRERSDERPRPRFPERRPGTR
ncbi:MAG: type VII secretion-associated serine protease mycosin [Gordonia sp. (in: high G+C Gram-positive bacteria)]|uniref:type VII secretion-associated serine protease mycosin n=1 Tax=Gordonia sp. (in: high G+C Gram-positive bacteria) TaxID=84139 RepID=UPI0039E60D6C